MSFGLQEIRGSVVRADAAGGDNVGDDRVDSLLVHYRDKLILSEDD